MHPEHAATQTSGPTSSNDDWVEVIEVGTRDGLQIERYIVPTARKVEILNDMIDSGLRSIEVTSFVSPKAVPQLADAAEVLAGVRKRDDTCLMALVPNLKAAERAADTPLDAGVLLCSASETHNRKNLNRSIAESLAGFPEVAARQPASRSGAAWRRSSAARSKARSGSMRCCASSRRTWRSASRTSALATRPAWQPPPTSGGWFAR